MIALLGTLLGFGTSIVPEILGYFKQNQANKQELAMLEAKAKYAAQLSDLKIKELDAKYVREPRAIPARAHEETSSRRRSPPASFEAKAKTDRPAPSRSLAGSRMRRITSATARFARRCRSRLSTLQSILLLPILP